MIRSFKQKGLERFFEAGSTSGIQPEHARKLRLILGRLQAAKEVREKVAEAVKRHVDGGGPVKALAVVEVGENPASKVYIRMKEKAAAEVGFDFMRVTLPEETTQEELEAKVRELNDNSAVAGFLGRIPGSRPLDRT